MHTQGIFLTATDIKDIPVLVKIFSSLINDVSSIMSYLPGYFAAMEPSSHYKSIYIPARCSLSGEQSLTFTIAVEQNM